MTDLSAHMNSHLAKKDHMIFCLGHSRKCFRTLTLFSHSLHKSCELVYDRAYGKYFYVVARFSHRMPTNCSSVCTTSICCVYNSFASSHVVMYVTFYLYNLGCHACMLPTEVTKTELSCTIFYHYIFYVYQ